MKIKNLATISLFFMMALASSFLLVGRVSAATLNVDSTADTSDAIPGDGLCDNGSGDCTLRAAVEESEALAGADTINFSIPGPGPHTINLGTGLPSITQQLAIDGSTQPGAVCGTLVPSLPAADNIPHSLLIEIRGDGILSGNTEIFRFLGHLASGSAVKGLILSDVGDNQNAITVEGTNFSQPLSSMSIECNYLGTNRLGNSGNVNAGNGIALHNGATQANIHNNLASGGWTQGVAGFGDNNIHHNLLGVTADGNTALPNYSGAYLNADADNRALFTNNVASGNTTSGFEAMRGVNIENNFIGVSLSGQPLGNGGDGVFMGYGASDNTIGSAGNHNVISANGGNGVRMLRNNDCQSVVTNVLIIGNYIGTDNHGLPSSGFGNQGSGVSANETDDSCGGSVYKNRIGGDEPGEANIIAGNGEDGVRVYAVPWESCDDGFGPYLCNGTDVFSVSILPNSIFANGNLGINLAEDQDGDSVADAELGPNQINNFVLDYPATHANNYLNRPIVNSAVYQNTNLEVNYSFQAPTIQDSGDSLNGSDLVGFRLDFYASETASDGSFAGYAQGKVHIGSFIIDSSATNATHTFDAASISAMSNVHITATSTVLWKVIPDTSGGCIGGIRYGDGPPYNISSQCN